MWCVQAEDFTNEMNRGRREHSLNDALQLLSQRLEKINSSRAGASHTAHKYKYSDSSSLFSQSPLVVRVRRDRAEAQVHHAARRALDHHHSGRGGRGRDGDGDRRVHQSHAHNRRAAARLHARREPA